MVEAFGQLSSTDSPDRISGLRSSERWMALAVRGREGGWPPCDLRRVTQVRI